MKKFRPKVGIFTGAAPDSLNLQRFILYFQMGHAKFFPEAIPGNPRISWGFRAPANGTKKTQKSSKTCLTSRNGWVYTVRLDLFRNCERRSENGWETQLKNSCKSN
jgi:hypothetical protein